MPNWERNKRGDWSYYDESGKEVEGFNPLTDLIGKGWGAAKSFIEWSDPKLSRFESSVANVLGEGLDRVNQAREAIKAREDAIAEPIMKSIGDRLVWHDKALKEYGEPLTNHQYNKRKDDELYQDILDLDLRHRQSKFQRQHKATTDFFTKQNAGVE